jgi:hypothetical protein
VYTTLQAQFGAESAIVGLANQAIPHSHPPTPPVDANSSRRLVRSCATQLPPEQSAAVAHGAPSLQPFAACKLCCCMAAQNSSGANDGVVWPPGCKHSTTSAPPSQPSHRTHVVPDSTSGGVCEVGLASQPLAAAHSAVVLRALL